MVIAVGDGDDGVQGNQAYLLYSAKLLSINAAVHLCNIELSPCFLCP